MLLVGVVATVAMAVSGHAVKRTRHSGTLVAIDATTHTLMLQEVGPWTPGRSATATRTFALDDRTRFELVSRSATGGAFMERALTPSDARRGDYATVGAEGRGRSLHAVVVEIVRP